MAGLQAADCSSPAPRASDAGGLQEKEKAPLATPLLVRHPFFPPSGPEESVDQAGSERWDPGTHSILKVLGNVLTSLGVDTTPVEGVLFSVTAGGERGWRNPGCGVLRGPQPGVSMKDLPERRVQRR